MNSCSCWGLKLSVAAGTAAAWVFPAGSAAGSAGLTSTVANRFFSIMRLRSRLSMRANSKSGWKGLVM